MRRTSGLVRGYLYLYTLELKGVYVRAKDAPGTRSD